jgi:hypothetical protein
MVLPETVRVKLTSEAAEAITITPVVVRDLPIRELIEHMLGVAGKDEARIREIFVRGSLVSGASRFRWPGWQPDAESIRELLATFPDPDPSLPFAAARCVRAVLRGGRQAIEIPRDATARKGVFQRAAFWDVLLEIVAAGETAYAGYSYRKRADRYVRRLARAEVERLRACADAVRFSTLREQIRTVAFTEVELYAERY